VKEGKGKEKLTDQALRHADRESHAGVEDDGQEVRDGVRGRRREAEERAESEDLQIARAPHVLAQVERLEHNIVAILLNPRTHESDLLLVQERQRGLGALGRQLGEVDDGEGADGAHDHRDDALHDEDPAPARDAGHDAAGSGWLELGRAVVLAEVGAQVAEAVHVREAISQDAREGGAHAADEVEDGVALLELVARVPAGEEVGAALGGGVSDGDEYDR
jgi:hypothetical protein